MPRLALALLVLWFVSLFVFRAIYQWRKTGSTGIKGFHGRIGSLPWFAGVTVSLGLALVPLAPLGALRGWPGGALLFESAGMHWLGAALILAGTAGCLLAQLSMGASWRVGVDESERTELVTAGLFSLVRNPIFSFIMVTAVGLVLLVPNALALVAGALTVVGIEIQVRAVEEPYLLRTHGEAYARYSATVGRFIPALGRRTIAK